MIRKRHAHSSVGVEQRAMIKIHFTHNMVGVIGQKIEQLNLTF